VQDQPVVRVTPERLGDDLVQLRFHLVRRLPWSEPGTVADAEDMGVDGERLFVERSVEHYVRGLTADARQ
jgi:hypothetical protein